MDERNGYSLTTFIAIITDGMTVWSNYVAVRTEDLRLSPNIADHARESATNGLRHTVPREVFTQAKVEFHERTEWISFDE